MNPGILTPENAPPQMPCGLLGSASTARLPYGMPAGVTDPRHIPSLRLWLDASNVVGMRQLSDGTGTVTHGDPLGYWPDLSGNGYNATQATTNNRPTYRVGVRNGRSVLRFDGVNDSYRVASLPLDATVSMFVVANFNTAGSAGNATGNLFIEHSANSNTNSGFYFAGQSSGPAQINRNVSPTFRWVPTGVDNWLGTGWAIAELRVSPGSTVDSIFTVRRNGLPFLNNAALQNSGAVTSDREATADLFIGSRNQASIFSNGDFGEILIYNRALFDAEQAAVRRYLAQKWGIGL